MTHLGQGEETLEPIRADGKVRATRWSHQRRRSGWSRRVRSTQSPGPSLWNGAKIPVACYYATHPLITTTGDAQSLFSGGSPPPAGPRRLARSLHPRRRQPRRGKDNDGSPETGAGTPADASAPRLGRHQAPPPTWAGTVESGPPVRDQSHHRQAGIRPQGEAQTSNARLAVPPPGEIYSPAMPRMGRSSLLHPESFFVEYQNLQPRPCGLTYSWRWRRMSNVRAGSEPRLPTRQGGYETGPDASKRRANRKRCDGGAPQLFVPD